MTLREFLARHDLLAYAETFERQGIPLEDCPALTDKDLREVVGMSRYMDRKRFLEAMVGLSSEPPLDALPGATRVLPTSPPAPTPAHGLSGPTQMNPGATPTPFREDPVSGPTVMASSSSPGSHPSGPARSGPVPSLPDRLGSYRILARLGAGGMGTVVRARHIEEGWATTQGGDVAIKLIHPHLAEDATFRARFLKEAAIGRRMLHPSLVPIWDVVAHEPWLGTVMSFIAGEQLTARVRGGGAPVDEVIALLTPVAEAVDYLHSQGIVHRDLKPANIIVRPDGRPVVLDLGIAKDALATENHTRTMTAMGTSAWMAPEQADAKHVDGAADRYAFGLIAYALLAGRLPWREETSENRALAMKLYGQLERLDTVRGGLSEYVVGTVMRMVALEAGDRFPSCLAFVEGLRRDDGRAQRDAAVLREAEVAEARVKEEAAAVARAQEQAAAEARAVAEAAAKARSLGPKAGETWQSPTLGMFRGIPAGRFRMGDPGAQHDVTLTRGFWLMQHPVTQRQWQAVMGNNPSRFQGAAPSPGGPDHPVEQVSWNDAVAFAEKVSAREGVRYRLPTEAEWEYAARGGQGHVYSGSDDADAVAWHRKNSGSSTHPVGQKAANGYGLRDMSGNVWEWVADWYEAYPSGSATDPTGAAAGSYRVFRGGGWYGNANHATVASRGDNGPDNANGNVGFRLSRSIS